jgi:hypothetical protein
MLLTVEGLLRFANRSYYVFLFRKLKRRRWKPASRANEHYSV